MLGIVSDHVGRISHLDIGSDRYDLVIDPVLWSQSRKPKLLGLSRSKNIALAPGSDSGSNTEILNTLIFIYHWERSMSKIFIAKLIIYQNIPYMISRYKKTSYVHNYQLKSSPKFYEIRSRCGKK